MDHRYIKLCSVPFGVTEAEVQRFLREELNTSVAESDVKIYHQRLHPGRRHGWLAVAVPALYLSDLIYKINGTGGTGKYFKAKKGNPRWITATEICE